MRPEILAQEGYTSVSVDASPVRELFPGIRLRPLWQGPTGARSAVVRWSDVGHTSTDLARSPRAPSNNPCSR
ncbi:hypothetical protein AB0B51_28750, partial [Streptomyces griseus]